MSKVNFMREFQMMMQFAQDNDLTAGERMLWIALIHIANKRAVLDKQNGGYEWPDGFISLSNAMLTDYSGLDKRAIERAREGLKELGVIDFEPGFKRRNNPTYKLNYLSIERVDFRGDVPKEEAEGQEEEQDISCTEAEYPQVVPKVSPKCPQNVPKVSPKCPQNGAILTSSFYRNSININNKSNSKSNEYEEDSIVITARARARERPPEHGNGFQFVDLNEMDGDIAFIPLFVEDDTG